jgi:hypothetical protein
MAFLAVAGATRIGREPQVTPVMVDSACWGVVWLVGSVGF